MINKIILRKVEYYVEKKLLQYLTEDEFIDSILDYCGSKIKYIGYAGLEWLKQKYMIGKYSNELKKKFSNYNKATDEYENITKTFAILIQSGDYEKSTYTGYIKSCNRLNQLCKTFKDVLPELNYLKPTQAINNYITIRDYMYLFTNRKIK